MRTAQEWKGEEEFRLLRLHITVVENIVLMKMKIIITYPVFMKSK
jgi:hypothetical protein